MLVLYGTARSRASRSLLALEELGLVYEHRPLHPGRKEAEYQRIAALNPNARIPVLDDDGLFVWESMAINLYLADRYGAGGPLWPADPRRRAHLYQWTLWAQTEVDVPARHAARLGPDPELSAGAKAERLLVLRRLDAALQGSAYLLGPDFTLADLNLAATLSEPGESGRIEGDLEPADHNLPALADWLARCTARPSWQRVAALP